MCIFKIHVSKMGVDLKMQIESLNLQVATYMWGVLYASSKASSYIWLRYT